MKKYSRNHIGFKTVTREGYEIEVVDGSDRGSYCTVLLGGHKLEVQFARVARGGVKNRNHPSVCGVGYIGYGEHNAMDDGRRSEAYRAWSCMFTRCYSKKYQQRQPTYIGCTVHSDWHSFQVFAEWFKLNYVKGFELDKDIKVKGNRVYSAETCMFVSAKDNKVESSAKHYKFLSPRGYIVEVYNLNDFCRKNGLDHGNMSAVHSGKATHHKGWKRS